MNAAINVLQIALENLETNEPIHRDEGKIEQAELEASSAEELRSAIGLLQMCSETRFKRDTHITVASPNLPDGPAWFALAEWDTVRKCYVTLDPMYPHPAPKIAEYRKVLAEHSGCGNGMQVDQITVRLEPGDKVILLSRTGFDGSEKSDVG